jgi:hypothetical protein
VASWRLGRGGRLAGASTARGSVADQGIVWQGQGRAVARQGARRSAGQMRQGAAWAGEQEAARAVSVGSAGG